MANLKTIENLRLAWIRTLGIENADYRNLQRIEFDAFGWAETENLLHLLKELKDNTFSPTQGTKIYIPKPSGLLRPLTVLTVRDTIIYQAVANVIAEKARKRLSKYYFNRTFSNMLTSTDYIYFFKQWKFGRKKLDEARKQAFKQGFVWYGELDLASFYDVIDHTILGHLTSEFYSDEDGLNLLFSCLSQWTVHPKGFKHGHGIPQGPGPSAFFAECVLHYLDQRMDGLGECVYFRYVDDITIMSKNQNDARKLFSKIEMICRELGLIPQIKVPLQELNTLESLMFPEPSAMQSNAFITDRVSQRQNSQARRIFLSCFRNSEISYKESQLISKLNYSLFRMNPDRRILNKIVNLIETMPTVSAAVNFYLRKFGENKDICGYLLKYLESEPIYGFAASNCLETTYYICGRGHFGRLTTISKKFLSASYQSILRSTAVKILGLRKIGINILFRLFDNTVDIYVKEHLLFSLANSLEDPRREQFLNAQLRSPNQDIAMIAAYLLTSNNLKLAKSSVPVNTWASPILKSKRLLRNRVIGDRVGDIIKKRYGVSIPVSFSFRHILSRGQYKQIMLHLNMAEGSFATNRSLWVVQMDNINQIFLTLIYRKLCIPVPMGQEFGAIKSSSLGTSFPNLAAIFERCHDASRENPVPHAYSRLLGNFSRNIKVRRRDNLVRELKTAYQEFINKY